MVILGIMKYSLQEILRPHCSAVYTH